MSKKPIVCVIDENQQVKVGWEKSLLPHAELLFYSDPFLFKKEIEEQKELVSNLNCLIINRVFSAQNVDIIKTTIPHDIRGLAYTGPMFLNWQGFVSKEDLHKYFDGKIFHRYGVRWHTLRMRIQRLDKNKQIVIKSFATTNNVRIKTVSRAQKCQELLKNMAKNANGEHRDQIEFYANHDQNTGIKLLEAIYNRILIHKERPENCPSRYINTSPVIAAKILHDVLH